MEKITVKTPIEECEAPSLPERNWAIVPILRAGAWHGERYAGTGTVCEGGTYRALPRIMKP